MEFVTLTKTMVWEMLQRERKDKYYSETGAVISLLFDKLEDNQKGKREYSRIWGWTWDKLRYNWDKIDAISEVLLTKSQHPSSTPPNTPKSSVIKPESKDSTPPNTPLTPHNYSITNNSNTKTYSKQLTNSVLRKTAKSFSRDSWQFKFSLAHLNSLKRLKVAPNSALKDEKKTIQSGAAEFDKLSRIDGHEKDEIKRVVTWLLTPDNWWIESGNYQSASKLRKHNKEGVKFFEVFQIQSRQANGRSSKAGTGNSSYAPLSAYQRISSIASAAIDPQQEPVARTGTGE